MSSDLKKFSQENKPVLCIIAGPNGSGKTTVTKTLLSHQWSKDSHYINPDNVANELFGDWNNADSVLKAAVECTKQRYDDLEKGKSLVFETVFSSSEKLDFVRLAKNKGYFIRLFYVCTDSPEINAARIMKRYISGGHMVPFDKIYTRYYKSLENLENIIGEIDRCYLYDNSVNDRIPKLIFRTVHGKIEKIYTSNIPSWSSELFTNLRVQSHEQIKLKI